MEESIKADQIIPVLVLSEQELDGGPEKLWKTLQYFVDNDDVCSKEFTSILVVKPSQREDGSVDSSPKAFRGSFSAVYHLRTSSIAKKSEIDLPSGPYFLSGQNLHQAWRFYPDYLDAFTFGLISENFNEPYRCFHAP